MKRRTLPANRGAHTSIAGLECPEQTPFKLNRMYLDLIQVSHCFCTHACVHVHVHVQCIHGTTDIVQ